MSAIVPRDHLVSGCFELTGCIPHDTLDRRMDLNNAVIDEQPYHQRTGLNFLLHFGSPRQRHNLRIIFPRSSIDDCLGHKPKR